MFCALRKTSPRSVELSAIVFSKDRPLQLSSLLHSMEYYCSNVAKINILYHTSSKAYEIAYAHLRDRFPWAAFQNEVHFRTDLIRLLKAIPSRIVFFLVDDIIFTDFFDATILANLDCKKHILSLRLHPGITYSYMTHREQEPPPLVPFSNDLLTFSWNNNSVDWGYPLSVDGHVFEKKRILKLIQKCDFKAPNSLEASLQAFTAQLKSKTHGICFGIPKIINFPVNKVQSEFANRAGERNPEDLLELFLQGYEIDFRHYEKCAYNSVHVDTELVLKKV